MKLRIYFPHIPRIFSANLSRQVANWSLFIILWAGLGVLVAINSTTYAKNALQRKLAASVLTYPLRVQPHMELAETLWDRGYQQEAKYEAAVAGDLAPNGAVLGATSPKQLLDQWNTLPQQLASRFDFWRRVTQEKPDYRDAYIQAAIAAFQMNKKTEALSLMERAKLLDPTSQLVRQLERQMRAQ